MCLEEASSCVQVDLVHTGQYLFVSIWHQHFFDLCYDGPVGEIKVERSAV